MARGYTTRKLEVFALHARTSDGLIDYAALFKTISSMRPEDRQTQVGEKLVAIPNLDISRGVVWFIAYEGALGVNPLIFNAGQAKERIQKLRTGEIVAHKTHGMIHLQSREAIIEYNHRGAKAADVSHVLEELARRTKQFKTLALELNPVADVEFVKAIDRFERIRVASLRVARPNMDWTDHYNNLTAVASDSEARTVEVSLTANRGGSLSTRHGIVHFIRDLATQSLSMLKGARLVGVRKGESAETAISLSHHIEHQKINVKMTEDGHVDDDDIKGKMTKYLAARTEGSKKT
jgi:hypothetical protein